METFLYNRPNIININTILRQVVPFLLNYQNFPIGKGFEELENFPPRGGACPGGQFSKGEYITGTAYFRRKYMTLTEKTVDFPPRAARRIQFNIEGDFPRPFLNEITSPPL